MGEESVRVVPVAHGLELGLSTVPRTPGLHMSDLYNGLYQQLEPNRYQRNTPPDLLRFEAGFALEEMLEQGLKRRLAGERPGEFITAEGIIYSPDLLIFNGSTKLGEIKLTWLSSREVPRTEATTFPPKFDKYLTQMKAYCYHLNLTDVRLYAFFVNGSYDRIGGMKPELLAWDITFTARELQDNWTMLVNHGRHAGLL